MKRISIVGLCLMAVFAFSAGAASSASAADLLAQRAGGASITGVTFLSTFGLAQLIRKNGEEIDCKDGTNVGLFLSSTLGDILIRFLGCKSLGVNCKTAGAAAGEIHLPLATTLFHLGLAHLVLANGIDLNIPAVVILLHGNVKLECGEPIVLAKIEVKGNVIGALQLANGNPLPLKTSVSEANLNFQQTSNGVQHLTLILLPGSTTPTEFDLTSSVNGGAFELSSEVANATLFHFLASGGTATNIELMEP
jgi:hypothetical protein